MATSTLGLASKTITTAYDSARIVQHFPQPNARSSSLISLAEDTQQRFGQIAVPSY